MLKRSVDIALAGLLLTFSVPLLLVAAILIKLDSAGPVIFCQDRVGKNHRLFTLLKLRTMRCGCPGPAFTLGEDPRVTRVGDWLRRSKIDELPQLLNVLRGEMSLVGPRPVIPELTIEFKLGYERLLQVRPGLTDPATLKYCQEVCILALVPEPLEYFKSIATPDKIRISQAYMEHAGVWSDLGVMLKTGFALFPTFKPEFSRQTFTRMSRTSAAHGQEIRHEG